jgi:hypothetical protein
MKTREMARHPLDLISLAIIFSLALPGMLLGMVLAAWLF